jgi:hypothetical protein
VAPAVTVFRVIRSLSLPLGLAVAGLVVAEAAWLSSPPRALLILGAVAWMAGPGVWLVAAATGGRRTEAAWMLGPAIGLGLSGIGLLAAWSAGVQSWWGLVLAPLPVWAVAALRADMAWRPAMDRRDRVAAAAVVLLVPLLTAVPFSRVGVELPEGRAYRAYFTADFVWAMAASSELSKGDVPPHNPFLRDAGLHYYWLSHLVSGAFHRNLGGGVRMEEILLLDSIAFDTIFVLFFYGLIRTLGVAPVVAVAAVWAAFLAASYEGIQQWWALWRNDVTLSYVRILNIDAITRWVFEGMPVDGLHRLLLYQPHHLTGYALGLAALWLVALTGRPAAKPVPLAAGVLVGASFLFSTFTAMALGAAVAAVYVVRTIRAGAVAQAWSWALLATIPVVAAVGASIVMGYVSLEEPSPLAFGANPTAFHRWPLMWLLSFGALLPGAVAGVLIGRRLELRLLPAVALALAATAVYFFVDVPEMGGVWVGWRAGHLLLIAFAGLTAAALEALWRSSGGVRITGAAAALALALAALPTVLIDVYNAGDLTNREQGAGFPWTLILSPDELELLAWLKHATPVDAIVQTEPWIRHQATWAHVPAFAERRMSAGLAISMTPTRVYEQKSTYVRDNVFKASEARAAWLAARAIGIDYQLVGTPERRGYPGMWLEFERHPELFAPVFRNNAGTVYALSER